ncbi:hypothetical protein BJV82DRAFT_632085 [Fennellomyces sp. T-0311]|nr:hypothetical protein BJV82DRAFT_632085 [Fennellomyces sp. T-0311]
MSSNNDNNNNNISELKYESPMFQTLADLDSQIQRLAEENRELSARMDVIENRVRELSRALGINPVTGEPAAAEAAVAVSAPRRYTKDEASGIRKHIHTRVKQLAARAEEPLRFNFDFDFRRGVNKVIKEDVVTYVREQTDGHVDDPRYVKDALLVYFNTLKRAYRLSLAANEEDLQCNRRRASVTVKVEAADADHRTALESGHTSEEESGQEGAESSSSTSVAQEEPSAGSGRGSQRKKPLVIKHEADDDCALDSAMLETLPWVKN